MINPYYFYKIILPINLAIKNNFYELKSDLNFNYYKLYNSTNDNYLDYH